MPPVGRGGQIGEELQSAGVVGSVQPFQKQAAEEPREHLHGQEIAEPARDPALDPSGADAAARHDHVHMRMMAPTPTIP